jgi:hypothetical protein
VKSFRFYLTERPDPPERTVEDYTSEELQQFLESFRVRRHRFNRWRLWWRVIAIPGALFLAIGLMLAQINPGKGEPWFEWMIGFIMFYWITIGVAAIAGSVGCPACRNPLNGPIGEYCRECGEKSVEKRIWPRDSFCSACGKSFPRESQPLLAPFRFCSVCGIRLDDETETT